MAIEFLDKFSGIIETVILIGGIGVGSFYIWRSRKNTSKDDAIKAYKDVVDAYTLKIDEFKKDLSEVKAENKDLQAQVNQLIGENKALRNVKPSAAFEETVKSILTEIKTLSTHQSNLREDFVTHSESDNTRFKGILDIAASNNEILQKLCPQATA